VETALTRPSR